MFWSKRWQCVFDLSPDATAGGPWSGANEAGAMRLILQRIAPTFRIESSGISMAQARKRNARMTDRSPLFGSAGFQKLVERFQRDSHSREGVLYLRSLGKRQIPSSKSRIPLGLMRLEVLRNELCFLIENILPEGSAFPFKLIEDPLPSLEIADLGVVYVQPESGMYSFRETGTSTNVIVTASEERLLDYIISMLAVEAHKLVPFTPAFAVRLLVGETLADVERHLVFSTLRVFNGNRYKACRSLGISEQELRLKLESLLISHGSQASS